MPSKSRLGKRPARAKPASSPHRPPAKPSATPAAKKPASKAARPAPAKSSGKSSPNPGAQSAPSLPLEVPLPGGRHHVLSLSFVRDGDEFMARLETDSGHITELKNRALDQLLTLVAGELEDLLD